MRIKKGKEKFSTRFFYLKEALLYSYEGKEDYPSNMNFMLGCFIEKVEKDA